MRAMSVWAFGAVAVLHPVPVAAQQPAAPAEAPPSASPPALDPASPMAPLPDLGVAWPDLAVAPAAPDAPSEAAPEIAGTARYRLVLAGLDALDAVRVRFDALSALVAGQGKPANAAQIDRRARDDEQLLGDLLRAAGYYDAEVSVAVRTAAGAPVQVTLTAAPGAEYRFTAVTLPGLEAAGAQTAALRRAFPVRPGDAVDADKVTGGVAELKAELGRRGFPFASVAEPAITIDHDTHAATLALQVGPGAAARFGRIRLSGDRRVFGPRHVARIARFRPGDPYDARDLDDLRRALIQTALVSVATVAPERTADPAVVDVAVHIERAPPRTVAAQLGYGTGEGASVEVSWQHRNFFRPEGAVTFRGVAGTREQSFGATLRRSNFHARDEVLTAQAIASHTNFDAYNARTLTLGVGLERQTNIIWQKKWTWSVGTEFVASDEKDRLIDTGQSRRQTYVVAALPASLAYDGSNDLLDPERGSRLSGHLSPEVNLRRGTTPYVKAQIDGSIYLPVNDSLTVAGRMRFGTIVGTGLERIAPSRRFYVGGGGSVRGYGFQDIGPKDAFNDPVGGRSLNEFSIEARKRFGNFGVVPFFDAGNLYTSVLPHLTGLRYGAGLGARYYTSFGPIRLDVGTPVNRRPGDARVTVYVSLGQAF